MMLVQRCMQWIDTGLIPFIVNHHEIVQLNETNGVLSDKLPVEHCPYGICHERTVVHGIDDCYK